MVKIIAEVGSNWKTLEDCLYSIRCAKVFGADSVKFQLYDLKSLYGFVTNWGCHVQNELPGTLPIEWVPQLKAQADEVGIEFMCSAFSPELIDVVDPYVNIHKIASSEMCHVRMLEKLRSIGKPVILSTGSHALEEIEHAVKLLGDIPVTIAYCVASYPAKILHLENIKHLKNNFPNNPIGYSDHSIDAEDIPLRAIEMGACLIEKHVNFVGHTDTPDAPHSLDQDEFRWMVKAIRGTSLAPEMFLYIQDKGMILRHRRRIKATKDIKAGEKLIEGQNFGLYRSLTDDVHAMHCFLVDSVNGRMARKDISAGNGIGPGDIG